MLNVIIQHLCIIHFVDVVTGKDQKIFRILGIDEIDILRNGICSSSVYIQIYICFLTWRKYINTAVLGIKPPASAGCYITV